MIAAWVWWANFWLAVMTGPPERTTAQVFHIDDYRPTNDNGTKKPPRRAA